jgi:hypothetical protein
MSLIDKIYKENKVIFHVGRGLELHHLFSRIGVMKCCPRMWKFLTKEEHNDWKVLKKLRQDNLIQKQMVENNFIRKVGCKRMLFMCCENCQMPIIDRDDVMKLEGWYADKRK